MTTAELFAGLSKPETEEKPDTDQSNEKFEQLVQALVMALVNRQPEVSVKNFPKFPEMPKFDNSDVVDAIKGISFPEQDMSDLIQAIKTSDSSKAIIDALKQLDMRPEVHVDAPIVNVPETDFNPVIKAIKASKPEPTVIDNSSLEKLLRENLAATKSVKDTLMKLKFPSPNVPTDPLVLYMLADLDDAGTTQYWGHTQVGGAWYIRKFDTSTSPKTNRMAFGQSGYSTAWTNRASLTYTIWGA